MEWIGITGSCRVTNNEVERDVRAAVRKIIERGDGIVTGGAFCVDWFATDEALKLDGSAAQIKVCIPVRFALYAAHYRRRAEEGLIAHEQVRELVGQLAALNVANSDALLWHPTNTVVDRAAHFDRNSHVVSLSNRLLAFHVNGSDGVQDTIDKALRKGKPVGVKKYVITETWCGQRGDSPRTLLHP